MNMNRVYAITALLSLGALLCLGSIAFGSAQVPQTPLDGSSLTKYIDPLPHFSGTRVDGTKPLKITMEEFQQHVLPSDFQYPAPFTGTYVWGYKTQILGKQGQPIATFGPLYPAFTIEAQRGISTKVTYVNNLQRAGGTPPFLQEYLTIDQTLHWANPFNLPMMDPARMDPYKGPAPAVVHVHGAEVPSEFDGGPDEWFTPNGLRGAGYRTLTPTAANAAIYQYPNTQEAATIWFHDHTLGGTRLNVFAGLAGYWWLRDFWMPGRNPHGTELPNLPGGPSDTTVIDNSNPANPKVIKAEIEFAIQDRMFDTNGQWFFPDIGINPEHPFWIPEFFGDVILVNGKPWPFFNVEPRRYRIHFLDGSNARFYNMWLENFDTHAPGPAFWQIGTDGGMLNRPVKIDPADPKDPRFLLMGPGERCDIIIDFAGFEGQTLLLRNDANAPFPDGDPVNLDTTAQIMQFRVGKTISQKVDPSFNPASNKILRRPMDQLKQNKVSVKRQLTLAEIEGAGGPLEVLVNNSKWDGKRADGTPIPGAVQNGQGEFLTELPELGTTELWEIINLTVDAHPIHLHLAQFQLQNRQDFDQMEYQMTYEAAFPGGAFIPDFGPPLPYNKLNEDRAVGGNPAIGTFLAPTKSPPEPNEEGWKDTVIMYPGQVTRILVRFARQDGKPYLFDASGKQKISFNGKGKPAGGPGYVWHCHIVDHEDNEMMRPYIPVEAKKGKCGRNSSDADLLEKKKQ